MKTPIFVLGYMLLFFTNGLALLMSFVQKEVVVIKIILLVGIIISLIAMALELYFSQEQGESK